MDDDIEETVVCSFFFPGTKSDDAYKISLGGDTRSHDIT